MVMLTYISQSLPAGAILHGMPHLSFKNNILFRAPHLRLRNVHLSFMDNKSALVHQHLLQHEAYLQKGPTGLVNAAHTSRHGLPTWRMIPICRRAWSTLRHHFRGKNTSISSCRWSRFDPFPLNTRCGSHVQAARAGRAARHTAMTLLPQACLTPTKASIGPPPW